jgi:hypothetical protein
VAQIGQRDSKCHRRPKLRNNSIALPAWYLGHNPSERVVAVSYSADLARTHANDFRRVVNDPLYQAVFPKMRVSRDTDNEIHTTERGRRYATSIGGTLTGRGGNLIIIDDPLKPSDAVSDVSRQRVIEWYSSTLVTRADDKQTARTVVVMQRIHVDDLVGHLQEQDAGFEVLNLPAIAQSTATYDLGGGRTHTRENNGASYVAGDLADWLEDKGMQHVRGAPHHPQTQGKFERWHQTLKNRILLNNYYLPGDLEQQIGVFVEHYNHIRYHESIENLTPADVYFGRARADPRRT